MLHMVYRSGGCDRSSRHPRAGRISANLTQYVPARRTQKSSPAFRLYEIATILGICKAKRALTERRVNADTYNRLMIRTRSLPRLAPSTVRRSRLERWLATHIAVPLRLLVAPAGSGKTTLLLKYLPNSTVDAAYCALPPNCSPSALHEAIAQAFALPRVPPSYDDLLMALRSLVFEPTELAVDDVDNGTPETIAQLRRLIEDAPEHLTFIFSSRSREAIDAK